MRMSASRFWCRKLTLIWVQLEFLSCVSFSGKAPCDTAVSWTAGENPDVSCEVIPPLSAGVGNAVKLELIGWLAVWDKDLFLWVSLDLIHANVRRTADLCMEGGTTLILSELPYQSFDCNVKLKPHDVAIGFWFSPCALSPNNRWRHFQSWSWAVRNEGGSRSSRGWGYSGGGSSWPGNFTVKHKRKLNSFRFCAINCFCICISETLSGAVWLHLIKKKTRVGI